MSVKKDLLQKIKNKADKIKQKRIDASVEKTLETAIFDFFKNVENSLKKDGSNLYEPVLYTEAKKHLLERVRSFDKKAKISIEFSKPQEPTSWEAGKVRGVTIWWSKEYINQNKVDPSLYTDVSQMLFS